MLEECRDECHGLKEIQLLDCSYKDRDKVKLSIPCMEKSLSNMRESLR